MGAAIFYMTHLMDIEEQQISNIGWGAWLALATGILLLLQNGVISLFFYVLNRPDLRNVNTGGGTQVHVMNTICIMGGVCYGGSSNPRSLIILPLKSQIPKILTPQIPNTITPPTPYTMLSWLHTLMYSTLFCSMTTNNIVIIVFKIRKL